MRNEQNREQIENFLYNIAWLRKHHGLSKKEMAARLEISVWRLTQMERGTLPPTTDVDVVMRIYKEFGVRPSEQFVKLVDKK